MDGFNFLHNLFVWRTFTVFVCVDACVCALVCAGVRICRVALFDSPLCPRVFVDLWAFVGAACTRLCDNDVYLMHSRCKKLFAVWRSIHGIASHISIVLMHMAWHANASRWIVDTSGAHYAKHGAIPVPLAKQLRRACDKQQLLSQSYAAYT